MILKKTNEASFIDSAPQPTGPFRKLKTYLKRIFSSKTLAKKIKGDSSPAKPFLETTKEFEAFPRRDLYRTKLAPSIQKTMNVVLSETNTKVSFHKKISQEQTAKKADPKILWSLAFNDADIEYRPSQHELDAFRMKAISLMKKKGLLPETISEALKAPIKVNVDEINQNNSKHLKIKLSQRFGKLGEEFELEGIFLKRIKSQYSIPVRGSFVLNSNRSDV
ncbi:MAG: hypothetical protein ACSNEK_01605 [Parachlamydiaceae bacterium]